MWIYSGVQREYYTVDFAVNLQISCHCEKTRELTWKKHWTTHVNLDFFAVYMSQSWDASPRLDTTDVYYHMSIVVCIIQLATPNGRVQYFGRLIYPI